MKKNYQKPTMNVVKVQQMSIICASEVNSSSSNTNIHYVGSDANYKGGAQSRGFGGWDDDE